MISYSHTDQKKKEKSVHSCQPSAYSPSNVFSQRPAFQSFMVLSADPDNIRPCSGKMTTAHTAAEWPWSKFNKDRFCSLTKPCDMFAYYSYIDEIDQGKGD